MKGARATCPPIEQPGEIGRVNDVAGICHAHAAVQFRRTDGEFDIGAGVRMPQRVGQEVADGAPNHQAVARHRARPKHPQTNFLFLGERIEEIQQTGHLVF